MYFVNVLIKQGKIDVSQANNVGVDEILLMCVNGQWCISRKAKGPKIEHSGTLASTGVHAEDPPFSTIF